MCKRVSSSALHELFCYFSKPFVSGQFLYALFNSTISDAFCRVSQHLGFEKQRVMWLVSVEAAHTS